MSTEAPEIVLEMRGVTVMYGSARGIEDVSLSIEHHGALHGSQTFAKELQEHDN